MPRPCAVLLLLMLAGCASAPDNAYVWRGHAAERVKVQLVSTSESLPEEGWVIESEPDQALGRVKYKKWVSPGHRVTVSSYFQVQKHCETEKTIVGRLETRNGSSEFCVSNPVHGGFMDADAFVITHEYDYCARLVRDGKKPSGQPREPSAPR